MGIKVVKRKRYGGNHRKNNKKKGWEPAKDAEKKGATHNPTAIGSGRPGHKHNTKEEKEKRKGKGMPPTPTKGRSQQGREESFGRFCAREKRGCD